MVLHLDVRQQNTYIDCVCVCVCVSVCGWGGVGGQYGKYMHVWQHVLLEMLNAQ
jgi:hypothetical protein